MTSARVKLDRSGELLLASDALSVRANLDDNRIPKNNWDTDVFLKSLDETRRIEKGGAQIICDHNDAQ